MSDYQPKNKSFERYIQIGYEFASGKRLSEAEMALLEKISDIDTSIIKIDDILDHEERRNDHTCIYLIDGIDKTIINARLDEINGVQALTDLIAFRKCFPLFSYEILKVFNNNYTHNTMKPNYLCYTETDGKAQTQTKERIALVREIIEKIR